ncbi:GspH/FimT family pseudopilin [uncultured Variovorax sp.]|uniref:GspH/FimT family pseudopilin n=1 Tax=uncultured Variovorax sp. TaxID=114708 RepID=UPI0025DF4410|nr:GspH/FimT family pseudopilin [uncultured Variovorax sp.]
MLSASRQDGFSLIELMVTLVVFAVMAAMAAPSLMQYANNMKILAAADSLYASLQQTRSEAIRRNIPVELVFTTDAPVAASVETTALTDNGPNWLIRQTPEALDDPHVFIEGKSGAEGGGRAGQGTPVVIDSSSSSIRFDASGALVGSEVRVGFNQQGATCALENGPARCLRVVASKGGQVRVCDPAALGAGDTRKC